MTQEKISQLRQANHRLLTIVTLFLFSFFQSNALFAGEGLGQGISVSIEPLQSEYRSNDDLSIRVSYKNTSNDAKRFLKWNTALESIVSDDFLDITLNGLHVPYIGMHIKRLPPKDSDFITLAPGQLVSGVIDLSSSYSIISEGQYQILYKGVSVNSSSEAAVKAVGGAVLNVVEARAVQALRREPIINNSCTATQVSQINQALSIAEQIAIRASNDLNNAPANLRPSARRYVEWFGAHTAARYEIVRRGMQNIRNALVNERIGFDCTCNDPRRENLFAFVFTNDPFNMNVCPVFFRTTASGTDSRSGTIVHEISHFTVVAATDDFSTALDQAGSRALARANPNNAVRNANAFEYFAENTPFLPMPAATSGGGNPPGQTPDPEPEPQPSTSFLGGLIQLLLGDD